MCPPAGGVDGIEKQRSEPYAQQQPEQASGQGDHEVLCQDVGYDAAAGAAEGTAYAYLADSAAQAAAGHGAEVDGRYQQQYAEQHPAHAATFVDVGKRHRVFIGFVMLVIIGRSGKRERAAVGGQTGVDDGQAAVDFGLHGLVTPRTGHYQRAHVAHVGVSPGCCGRRKAHGHPYLGVGHVGHRRHVGHHARHLLRHVVDQQRAAYHVSAVARESPTRHRFGDHHFAQIRHYIGAVKRLAGYEFQIDDAEETVIHALCVGGEGGIPLGVGQYARDIRAVDARRLGLLQRFGQFGGYGCRQIALYDILV